MWRILYVIMLILIQEKTVATEYGGEKFPLKYLIVDDYGTPSDLDRYIHSLHLSFGYFNSAPNSTEVNIALAVFFTKSILKRTLLDFSSKISRNQIESIRKLINVGENILSHYMYENMFYDWSDFEYSVSRLFVLDDSQVYTIGDFNRNRLKKWIITKDNDVNSYLEQMDFITFPKEKYCEVTHNHKDFHISISNSDYCISQISYNKEPIDFNRMQKCESNAKCEKAIYRKPSVAYTLSHRLLNIYLRHSIKRCYIKSEEEDRLEMDQLCANMYREAVYLARRGFFARDLFLEHVALCSLLGYEEFHRRNWYYKAMSWIRKEGCIQENRNFKLNRTKWMHVEASDLRTEMKNKEFNCKSLCSECEDHPTAVLLIVLAEAIRYSAYIVNCQTNLANGKKNSRWPD